MYNSLINSPLDGKCIDTSMGLTPLEGLVMGTRSGDIDGGAVTFLEKKLGLDADGMSNLLNKKSGVAGITGGSSDMRDVENAAKAGEPKAVLAQQMYFYRIKKYIGAYAAALGGVDVIVFTAGVGWWFSCRRRCWLARPRSSDWSDWCDRSPQGLYRLWYLGPDSAHCRYAGLLHHHQRQQRPRCTHQQG